MSFSLAYASLNCSATLKMSVGFMKYMVMIILITGTAFGQNSSYPLFSVHQETTTPKNVHDYALSRIKALNDYMTLSSKLAGGNTYLFVFRGFGAEDQSLAIDKDGNIRLKNMSTEDALLMLYAIKADEDLARYEQWDREEREREEERKSIPPSPIRVGIKTWNIFNEPTPWSKTEGVLADTNCYLGRIRSLKTDGAKRSSVMHEILHVASNCREDHNMHAAIYVLAPALVKILQDNPDLVDYLTKKHKPTPAIKKVNP